MIPEPIGCSMQPGACCVRTKYGRPRSLSGIAFMTRWRRRRQLRGRRPGKTGSVFAGLHWGFFL